MTTTTYDSTQTFPQTVTNALGQSGTIYYDTRFGKPTQKIDANQNSTSYQYDGFGRLTSVVEPGDSDSLPTRKYTYSAMGTVGVGTGQYVEVQAIWKSGGNNTGNNYYTTYIYFDGFTRKIGTLSDGPGSSQIEVDIKYDQNGRVFQKSYPYFVGQTAVTVTYSYDSLGRVLDELIPGAKNVATHISMSYSNGSVTITDQKRNMTRQEQRDGFGRLTSVTEYLASGGFTTIYSYDALGNLISVQDALNNIDEYRLRSSFKKNSDFRPDHGHMVLLLRCGWESYPAGGRERAGYRFLLRSAEQAHNQTVPGPGSDHRVVLLRRGLIGQSDRKADEG